MKTIPVDTTAAGLFQFIAANPKQDQNKQQTANQDGVPQWKIQVLLTPADGSKASLEEINIAQDRAPEYQPMTPLAFQNLVARHWEMGSRSGVSLSCERIGAAQTAKAA